MNPPYGDVSMTETSYVQQTERLSLHDSSPGRESGRTGSRSESPPYIPAALDDVENNRGYVISDVHKYLPVIVHYPVLSDGSQDDSVREHTYHSFARPTLSALPSVPHYTMRFWIKFETIDGVAVTVSQQPALLTSKTQRAQHSSILLKKLVADKILEADEVDEIAFYYGSMPAVTQLAGGVSNTGPDSEAQPYLDVKIPSLDRVIYEKLCMPRQLSTDKTHMVFFGQETGLGPTAHPSYVVAECSVPERIGLCATGQDYGTFKDYLSQALKSFAQHKDKIKSELEIVACGGFFESGDIKLSWDYRIFTVFKVPVRTLEQTVSTNSADFKEEIEKFPPFMTLEDGKRFVRNSYIFCRGCSECRNEATVIHKDSEHLCSKCNTVGHVVARCPLTVAQRQKRAREEDKPMLFTAVLNPVEDMTTYQEARKNSPARQRIREYKERMAAKRRRISEAE